MCNYEEKKKLHWKDEEHRKSYEYIIRDLEGAEAPWTRPMVALLTGCRVTREHFWEIYDNNLHAIKSRCLEAAWNTQESRLLIAMAAVLSGDVLAHKAAEGTLALTLVDAVMWSKHIEDTML